MVPRDGTDSQPETPASGREYSEHWMRSPTYIFDLKHGIGQIPCADMLECSAEESSLAKGRDAGNNDDDPGMQWFSTMKRKKIGTIVGYKRVVLCANCGHELPVFRTAETEIIDMICHESWGVDAPKFNDRFGGVSGFSLVLRYGVNSGDSLHAEPHLRTPCHYQIFF